MRVFCPRLTPRRWTGWRTGVQCALLPPTRLPYVFSHVYFITIWGSRWNSGKRSGTLPKLVGACRGVKVTVNRGKKWVVHSQLRCENLIYSKFWNEAKRTKSNSCSLTDHIWKIGRKTDTTTSGQSLQKHIKTEKQISADFEELSNTNWHLNDDLCPNLGPKDNSYTWSKTWICTQELKTDSVRNKD